MKKIIIILVLIFYFQNLQSIEFGWKKSEYHKKIHTLIRYIPENVIGPYYGEDHISIYGLFVGKRYIRVGLSAWMIDYTPGGNTYNINEEVDLENCEIYNMIPPWNNNMGGGLMIGLKLPIWKLVKMTGDYDFAYCGGWAEQMSAGIVIDLVPKDFLGISLGVGITSLQLSKKRGEFFKEKSWFFSWALICPD